MPHRHPISPSNAPAQTGTLLAPNRAWVALALLAVVICLAYFPAVRGGFLWDDNAHVTKPELRSWHGLQRIWFDVGATQQYYPLLHSFFWFQYQLWGELPLGYHLVNLLLHAAAVYLVYLVLLKLRIPGALLAAAIFALHPVQVETAGWITEQKNTLSTVFYLCAMLVYLQFDQLRKPAQYVAALGLFFLALLSKPTTLTLPAALLVILWWQRGSLSWRRDVRPLIPFFLLAVCIGLFIAWVERRLGAEGSAFEMSLVERGLLANRAMWFYLCKLLWPANLIFVYPRWEIDPTIWWQWLFPLATVALLAALWIMRGWSRAPLAGWLFFVGTLLPLLGFFNAYLFAYTFVADHFQYLASLGIIVPLAAGLATAVARLPASARWAGNVSAVALVAVLAALSWRQCQMYSDSITLYQATIERNPNCWMAYNNLGLDLAKTGQTLKAMQYYQEAIRLNPHFAFAYRNLGDALLAVGRKQDALKYYQEAVRLIPEFSQARLALGALLMETGQTQEALLQFQQIMQLEPGDAGIHNTLGNAFSEAGRLPEAVQQFQEAIRLQPDYPDAHYNLGNAFFQLDRLAQAVEQYQLALQFNPDFAVARNNLANALVKMGRMPEALEQYQQTLRLQPNDLKVYSNLTTIYMKLQRPQEAIATAEQALKLARAQDDTAGAQKIESWLANYRAELTHAPQKQTSQQPPATP